MRFSLKDILAIVAFSAVVLACASFVGFDNGAFWFTVGGSVLMSALFVVALVRRPRRLPKSPVVFFFFSLILFSVTLLFNSFALLVSGLALANRDRKTIRGLLAVVGVIMLLTLYLGMAPGIIESRKLRELREQYPIVSLEHRLQYEKPVNAAATPTNVTYSGRVLRKLVADEESLENATSTRSRFLRIHNYEADKFVEAMGFGVSRMSYRRGVPTIEEREPLRDIRFDQIDRDYTKSKDDLPPLETMHMNFWADFLSPEWWGGIVEPTKRVVGFVPHAIHRPRQFRDLAAEYYSLDSLQLVSLLKFDEPRVYVLDHLPRMDQLSSASAPTRNLDAFETGALPKLRAEEDLVIAKDDNSYRMLGSLRAAQQCLDCHSVQRGELLGAFSYAIRADRQEPGGL